MDCSVSHTLKQENLPLGRPELPNACILQGEMVQALAPAKYTYSRVRNPRELEQLSRTGATVQRVPQPSCVRTTPPPPPPLAGSGNPGDQSDREGVVAVLRLPSSGPLNTRVENIIPAPTQASKEARRTAHQGQHGANEANLLRQHLSSPANFARLEGFAERHLQAPGVPGRRFRD